MSDREDAVLFDGVGPLSSSKFVRIVRQSAIEKDKTADDQWIAFYAASRMDGPALDWLESQTEETQESWRLFRRALLIRWPAGEPGSVIPMRAAASPMGASIPTPAAAAPPPPAAASFSAAPVETGRSHTGIMRATTLEGADIGYLSMNLDTDGNCIITKLKEEAQIIHFTPSHKPYSMHIVDNSPNAKDSVLGYTMGVWTDTERGSLAHHALITGTSDKITSSSKLPGDSYAIKWSMSFNRQLMPFKETPGGLQYLDIAVTAEVNSCVFTPNLIALRDDYPHWESQQLIFVCELDS